MCFAFQMPKQCVVGGCSIRHGDGVPLHSFPKDKKRSHVWDKFVKTTRKDWCTDAGHSNLYICGLHFTEDKFENLMQWRYSAQKCLMLKADAVPTLPVKLITIVHRKRICKPGVEPVVPQQGIISTHYFLFFFQTKGIV